MKKANLRLKAVIVETGKSPREVAKNIEMPYTTFSRKLNGWTPFTELEMEKICIVLNKSPLDIFFADTVTKWITKSA